MVWLILIACLAAILSIVFAVITLVKKIQKKECKRPWTLCRISFGACFASLLIGISSSSWNILPILVAILLILYGIFQGFVFILRKLIKKDLKNSHKKSLFSLGIGLCIVIVSSGGSLSSTLDLFAALLFLIAFILLIVNIVMAIAKRKKKLFWLSVPICLILGIALVTVSDYSWNKQLQEKTATGEIYEAPIQITYDFEVVDGDAPIEIIPSTSTGSYVRVFDDQDLHLALETTYATPAMCIEAIKANDKIDARFKTFLYDFVDRLDLTYPGLNLAIFYNNLKTLDIQELSSTDYFFESFSMDSLGCYNVKKNTIFIPEGTEYIEGEFGFQVLIHELCHAARDSRFDVNSTTYWIDFYSDSDNTLLMEAMNSVFSCSLLNYYEWDIAYQVPSNYMRIMLECMDNYQLEDYFNHRDTYFLSKLDEFTGNTNYGQVIWKLITLQRSDWEDDKIDIPAEDYFPIYDFLCEMYYDKYIADGMTDEEKRVIADELVYKAFYDAPANYKIAPEYFYEYLGLA